MRVLGSGVLPGFSHTIQVDKNLVRLLSDQTYTSFTNCIRELVVNAYDADATQVTIDTDIPRVPSKTEYAGSLTIVDNGHGMTVEEFVRLTQIAPGRMPTERSRRFGRPRVGRFGIGYLAAFPFCESMEIRTRTATDEEIVATFDCAAYFKRSDEFVGIERVPVAATVERQRSIDFAHASGTSIVLRGLTREGRHHLTYTRSPEAKRGRKVESIFDWPAKKRIAWELGQMLPVPWPPPYDEWQERLGIERRNGDPGISVHMDRDRVFKPWPVGSELHSTMPTAEGRDHTVFLSGEDPEPEHNRQRGNLFTYRLLVITPHKPVEPKEFRGIQLRLRGVGLGPPLPYRYIPGFLEKDNALVRSTIEVHLTGGFDRLITLDRTHIKRGSWAYALFEDLARRIMTTTNRRNLGEARLVRKIGEIKKGGLSGTKEDVRRDVHRYAEEIGYKVQEEDIAQDKTDIDFTNQTIYLPKEISNPTMQLGGRTWQILLGEYADNILLREWVQIVSDSQIRIAPALRKRAGKSDHKYERVLEDLARVEHERFKLAQQNKDPVARKAMHELAIAIKNSIVEALNNR